MGDFPRNAPAPARQPRAGHAVIEFAFLVPWLFFLFIGLLDFGFFANAIISTQNAARVAALYTSSSTDTATDNGGACFKVLEELRALPNVGYGVSACDATPVQVTAEAVSGADSTPAARVTVSYRTILMIPIPGLLSGQFTFTRTAEFRIRENT